MCKKISQVMLPTFLLVAEYNAFFEKHQVKNKLVLISPIAGKPLLRLFHTFISPKVKKLSSDEDSFFTWC